MYSSTVVIKLQFPSANYLVLYSSVHCCTAAIATQLGPGWTVSPNGSLTIQYYAQL